MFVKQRALAAEFVGKRVGSEFVNIVDDPSLAGGYGSYFFDDEGVISSPTKIVVNGIFERGLSDLMSATALGVPRSANGRRQDFSRKCYARMSNTFFAPGTQTTEELVAGVKQGYFLTKLSHGLRAGRPGHGRRRVERVHPRPRDLRQGVQGIRSGLDWRPAPPLPSAARLRS